MEGMRPKGVIWYIAARPCLRESLELLYRNFSNEFHYPVIVHTFGKIYSDSFYEWAHKELDPTIRFIELEKPEIPVHIAEQELFYNRTEIPYVRKSFPKSRVGFLHVNQFVSGEIMGRLEMQEYDYTLKMDDDVFIVKKIDFDIFQFAQD